MTAAALGALLSHWRRAPLQFVTLVAGLALATALWSGVQAINAEARASYDAAAATLGEGRFAQVVAANGGPIPQARWVALRRAGWLVSPVVEGRLGGVRIVGIDPLTAPAELGAAGTIAGADLGELLSGPGLIFARPEVLAALPDPGPRPVAVPDVAPGTAITDIATAQRILGRGTEADRLILLPGQPFRQAPFAAVAPDLVVQAPQGGSDIGRLTDSFHLNLTAFGILAFAVGVFIVHGAVGLAVEQRRPTIRTLRALGVPLSRILLLLAAELGGLALLAGALGVALGYLIAAALLPDVAATIRGLYGADVAGTVAFRPAWWLSGLAIALGGAAAAGAGALWQIARMPVLAAAQPRAWALRAGRRRRLSLAAAAAFALAAGAAALWGRGLGGGFALLGCMLVAGALLLPPLLGAALALGERLSRRPLAQWFWADTRQQLPGLSLALMALLLAMAANVGVSTMVASFRLTFLAFLDQRLASELYVTARDAEEAAALVAFVGPRTDAVLPLMSAEAEVAGLPAAIYALRDHATYRDNWRLLAALPGAWDGLARGAGVLVNEQLARRAGLMPGDAVTLPQGLRLPVLGIYGDYGNPVGQVVLAEPLFRDLYPAVPALRFGLRLPPAGVEGLRRALVAEFGLPEGQIIDQAAIKQFSREVFERTFAVTGALNVLTLGVAAFAILMSLLTLAALRLPQLAPVWALGVTRARLGRLELLRAVLLAALTAALALPLGLLLAWTLLAVVNVEAFGWRLPMYLFPLDYLRLGLFAVVAAALAAALPALRLARTPPARLLQVFAHER
jgi:putative ABC transport system permease protein